MKNYWHLDRPFYWAPTRKLSGEWLPHKSSPDPPPAPDYAGAAKETAAGNLEAAQYATAANRVNQYSPYGSSIYSRGNPTDNADPQWSQTINLSPVGQQLLDYANNSSIGLGKQTGLALDRVNEGLSTPFALGGVQQIADQSYTGQTDRLDPQWKSNEVANDSSLANQGIVRGSEAYENAKRTFNQAKNDAYSQARMNSINTMPQTYQLAVASRQQPLNELNALRTGAQVTNPQFGSVPQQQTTAGANMAQAVGQQGQYDTGLYNADVGSTNSANSSGIAAAATIAAAFI